MIIKRVVRYIKGWLGYFSVANITTKLKELNGWIRRRLRQIYWKQWKNTSTRYKNLRKLGVDEDNAWKWASSSKGYWRIAGSQVLANTLTNTYLEAAGYVDILKIYNKLHSSC